MTMPGFSAMAGVTGNPRTLTRAYRSAAAASDEGVHPAHFSRPKCTPECRSHYYNECRDDGGTYDECLDLARRYCCPRPGPRPR